MSDQTSRSRTRPPWLRTRVPGGEGFAKVRSLLRDKGLHTVCEEARCPNKAECWGSGTATFLLLGDRCTRNCRFCSVTGAVAEPGPPDGTEPGRVVEAARILGLKHVVLTSVTRDDLQDGGAAHFAEVIRRVHAEMEGVTVEALIPPLIGDDLRTVLEAGPEVLAHNLEVVRRLTAEVRDPRADYDISLQVLAQVREMAPEVRTKSSLLLGLGETQQEVLEALDDMRSVGVEILAMGQYLQPTAANVEVHEWVTPGRFEVLRREALARGFSHVASGPFVRTSFRAHEALERAPEVPLIPYRDGIALMEQAQDRLRAGGSESVIVLRHPPVITLGRQADESNVRTPVERLAEKGIEVVRTTRGGEVTYHGPGQVVIYPVLDIGSRNMGTRSYVQTLLECTRRGLASLGIPAILRPDHIGVFVDDGEGPPAKVAALGVSISRGITGHGVAVNVTTVPEEFVHIVPCGLADVRVASVGRFIDPPPPLPTVAARIVGELRARFGAHLRVVPDPDVLPSAPVGKPR